MGVGREVLQALDNISTQVAPINLAIKGYLGDSVPNYCCPPVIADKASQVPQLPDTALLTVLEGPQELIKTRAQQPFSGG